MEDGNVPPPPPKPAPFPSRIWKSLGTEQCDDCDLKAVTGDLLVELNDKTYHLTCTNLAIVDYGAATWN